MENEKKTEKNFIKGFSLTGVEVKSSKNKQFVIVTEPEYDEFEDRDTGNVKETLKCKINFNGAVVDYHPNKTSCGIIMACLGSQGKNGRDLAEWVGFKGTFETILQKVGKEKKECVFVEVPEGGESK